MAFTDIFKRKAPPNKSTDTFNIGYAVGSTLLVNESTLLENPTVVSCINLISRSISLLPFNLYHKGPKGRRKAVWHDLYNIVRYNPNNEEPSSIFIEKIIRDMLTYGNAYLWKSYTDKGALDALYILDSKSVRVYRDPNTNQKKFDYADQTFTSQEILHIPGAAYDGLKGYSPANFASKAIEMGVSLDDYARTAFDNGPNTRLIIDASKKFPQGLKQRDELKDFGKYIQSNYSGKSNAGKPLILFDGVTATPVQVSSNKDAELVEARSYQEKIIAQMFQVPMFLLGKNDITYGNYESAMVSFLTFTLGPWMTRLEQYFKLLLTAGERINFYFEFDTSYLLRTDLASKYESYAKAVRTGILSVNEVREKENMDRLEDEAGDNHFIEANLVPLTKENVDAFLASAKVKLQQLGEEKELPIDKKVQ